MAFCPNLAVRGRGRTVGAQRGYPPADTDGHGPDRVAHGRAPGGENILHVEFLERCFFVFQTITRLGVAGRLGDWVAGPAVGRLGRWPGGYAVLLDVHSIWYSLRPYF